MIAPWARRPTPTSTGPAVDAVLSAPVSTTEPAPLDGLADPVYMPAPWPEGFDESSFRDHLDRLHARYDMGDVRPRRDRLRTWRDRYAREALDADRLAARLNFLADLAAGTPVPSSGCDALRALVVEARRGVPRVHTSTRPQYEQGRHEPNPTTIAAQVSGWPEAGFPGCG